MGNARAKLVAHAGFVTELNLRRIPEMKPNAAAVCLGAIGTGATIVGLLPIALKLGEGSEASAPLARAAVGGLTVSTILTLVLVPAVYELLYARRGRQQ